MDNLQLEFLNCIKDRIPQNHSLVDELSETLAISSDSAYRRLRGETALTINEIYALASKYGLSLDSLMDNVSKSLTFEYMSFVDHNYDSVSYMTKILDDLKKINSYERREVVYSAKDIPLFHLFIFPEIGMFKTFFWTKTIASVGKLENVKFSFDNLDEEVLGICDNILKQYNEIPSTEIWSDQTITSLLKQIEYYHDSGFFQKSSDAVFLCNKVISLLEHIKKQASVGLKLPLGDEKNISKGSFQMYLNEVILPDNTIIVKCNDVINTYLSQDVMNFLITNNNSFTSISNQTIENVISRSTLISKVSERERNKFFEKMNRSVQALIYKIEN